MEQYIAFRVLCVRFPSVMGWSSILHCSLSLCDGMEQYIAFRVLCVRSPSVMGWSSILHFVCCVFALPL